MIRIVGNDWDKQLQAYYKTAQFKKIQKYLINQYSKHWLVPSLNNVFEALKLTPFSKTKVVILGQDPYPGIHDAQGLSFSGNSHTGNIPSSLTIIYQDLENEYNEDKPKTPNLVPWTKQGVLLLNSSLTLDEDNGYNTYKKKKVYYDIWKPFTDHIIKLLSDRPRPIVFALWGRFAKTKAGLINKNRNIIEREKHPNAEYYAKKFQNGNHKTNPIIGKIEKRKKFTNDYPFQKINQGLEIIGEKPIKWISSLKQNDNNTNNTASNNK